MCDHCAVFLTLTKPTIILGIVCPNLHASNCVKDIAGELFFWNLVLFCHTPFMVGHGLALRSLYRYPWYW